MASPFLARLVARIRVVAECPEMVAIRVSLPISFGGLVFGLLGFMLVQHGGTLLQRFSQSFAAAFGVMSLVLVVVLAFDLAGRRAQPRALAVATAVAAFGLSLPYASATSIESLAKLLGSSGLFLALGIALVTVTALLLGRSRFGAVYGSAVAVAATVGTAGALLALGFSLTGVLRAAVAPLGNLGDSLTALLVITLLETLLWLVGIHGPALLAAVVLPVYIGLQVQNTEALARGQPLPHIVTVSFFLFVFPGGAGATFPLVLLLLRSRVKRVRTVAYAAFFPALANANEPLMFGLPLVLEPLLGVPFVVAPLVLAVVSYYAVALGFVARSAYYIPAAVPLPFGAFLATKDWHAVVLVGVNVMLALAIYAPFVAAYERHARGRRIEAAA